ncbi:MAG: MEDS domain-containing protein [Pseudomonadales bacterium]
MPDGGSVSLGFGGLVATVGDHIGHYYQDGEECVSLATDFFVPAFADIPEKCVCLAEPASQAKILTALADRGVDVARARDSGQLVMFGGSSSPADLEQRLHQELRDVPDRFRIIRWLGDMTWSFSQMADTETLMEWETVCNVVSARAVFLCQYDLHRFPGSVVVDALRSHPLSIIGETIYENPYYLDPQDFLSQVRSRPASALQAG